MPLLGKKKLGKPTSSDRADAAKSDVKQSTKQTTEKAQASESLSAKTDAPMQEDLSNVKKAAPSAVAASAPSTPGKASAVPSSSPTLPESTSSHARSHSFDLRRKLRMPSNRNLGNKSPFGFRRVRTGTDTLTTSGDTAAAEADQAATPETSKAKAPGTPGGFSLPMNSSSLSLRPFRSKESAPQTPKRSAKGKEKAREDDTVPPVPMIDPERFPNLASKTPQAAPRDTNTLSDDKLEVVLLPRFPTSGVPATPSASSQRAVTSPVYSELSRTSPHVPSTGGLAPSISGAGLNLSTFSSPTSPPAARPEMSPTSSRLPPYLMETLSLEPSKRILTLQSSSIEAEERDASVLASAYRLQATPFKDAPVSAPENKGQTAPGQGPSEADTSDLAGFMPPKVNPLSYLFGSKDSKSGGADESTATVIQRSEEPGVANEDEESVDGTHMSHAATVMYDADDFLDANSAIEAHDAEDTWYDPSVKEATRAARSSQAFRQMPGSVPSDFGHTEQPASLTAAPALKETLPDVHEDESSVRAPSSDLLNKALPVPAAVEEPKLAPPAAEPVDEGALTSSMGDETTTEPQEETKPTLLGSLSDAITTAASASSAGIAMLVGQRDKTPEPEAEPVADAETPSSAAPLSMVKPPVPPRMRPLMTPTESESDTVPAVAEAEPEPKEEPASDNIVPMVPPSLPSKSATPASETPVPTNTEEAAPATTEPGIEQAMEEGHAVSSSAEPVPEASTAPLPAEDAPVPLPSSGSLAADSEAGVSSAPVAANEPALEQPAPVSHDEDAKPLDPTTEQADVLAAKPAHESQLTEPVSERDTGAVTEPSSTSNVVAASVPEPAAEPAAEPTAEPAMVEETPSVPTSGDIPSSEATEPALEPALPVVTESSTAPVSEEPTTAPAPAEGNETEVPPVAPTPLAEAAPSDETQVPAEPSESAPAKVPVAQPVPFPASSQGAFAWAPAPSFTKESRLPQLPPVLGNVPDVPLKGEPLEAPLPTVPAADEAAPTPAALVSEPAAPEEPNVAESTADESSHRGIKRLSNVLSGGLLSSAALPAFLRKKDEPASQDEQADEEAAPPALPEKPRDSMLVPEPAPVSAPTVPATEAPAAPALAASAPIPEDVSARELPASAPAVANVGLPWSYVAPASSAPESVADESARGPATQPSVPLAPVATERLMASEPESEPVRETTADVVKWQHPVWPVAAREEAPLPDTPADTSASQGPLPWNLATTSFLPSAQTRFFESEHQLPHWHAPTESATGVRAPVDGTWSLPKLASEPVVAPDAVDEEPDLDWDLEQPSRRYATDVEEPPAERAPPFLQTVPEEQDEAPADTTVPEAEDRGTADNGRMEEDVKPAPALRGKGVYDPEMLNHFMYAMDESDYGRAVHRASTLGVPLEEIPSDTPAPVTQCANEPPRPSELFAGKGVRWDSPDWLRSRLHKVEGPSQQDFQAFLKKRRQIVPAFVWSDAGSSLENTKALEASKSPPVTTGDEAPTTATSSPLADWEQNESQPADARFSKLLLPADSYLLSDSEPIDTSLLSFEQLEKSYQGKARSPDPAWGGAPTLAPPAEDVPPAVPPKSHLGHGPLRTTQAASMPASPARQPDVELAQHLEQARRRQAAQYEQYDREQARLQQRVSVMPPPNDGHEFYDEFGGTRPLYEMEGRVPEEAQPTAAPPAPEPEYESATPTYPAHGLHDVPPSQADQGYHGAAYAHADYPQNYAQPDYASQGYTQPGYAPQGYAEQGYPQPGYAPQGYAPQGYAPQGYGPHYGYADPQYAPYGYPSQQEMHASYAQPSYGWDAYGHPNAYPSAYPDPNPPVDAYGASQASMPSPMDATQPRVAPSVSLTPLSRLGIPPAYQFSDSPFPTATSGPLSVGRDPMDMPFKPPTPKKGGPFRQGASPASLPGDVPVAPRHHGYASSARSAQFGRSTHRSRASGSRSGWNALLNADLYRSS